MGWTLDHSCNSVWLAGFWILIWIIRKFNILLLNRPFLPSVAWHASRREWKHSWKGMYSIPYHSWITNSLTWHWSEWLNLSSSFVLLNRDVRKPKPGLGSLRNRSSSKIFILVLILCIAWRGILVILILHYNMMWLLCSLYIKQLCQVCVSYWARSLSVHVACGEFVLVLCMINKSCLCYVSFHLILVVVDFCMRTESIFVFCYSGEISVSHPFLYFHVCMT